MKDLPDLKDITVTLVTDGSLLGPARKERTVEEEWVTFQKHVKHLEPDCGWKGPCEAIVAPELADEVRDAMMNFGALIDREETLPNGNVRLCSEGYWAHGFDCT